MRKQKEKAPITVIENSIIKHIHEPKALGIYAYTQYLFQNCSDKLSNEEMVSRVMVKFDLDLKKINEIFRMFSGLKEKMG